MKVLLDNGHGENTTSYNFSRVQRMNRFQF